jgi:hypothetical protein
MVRRAVGGLQVTVVSLPGYNREEGSVLLGHELLGWLSGWVG